MNIFNVKVYGLEESIIASGYPMSIEVKDFNDIFTGENNEVFTEKDLKRAKILGHAKAGSGHNCAFKGVVVQADVEMPQYFWLQWDRYHFHDVISSQSTMHRITKMDLDKQCNKYVSKQIKDILRFYIDHYNTCQDNDRKQELFQWIISNTPEGLNLTKRITTNYLQLKTIYDQRKNHKLEEWHYFCDWVEGLPRFKELILEDL